MAQLKPFRFFLLLFGIALSTHAETPGQTAVDVYTRPGTTIRIEMRDCISPQRPDAAQYEPTAQERAEWKSILDALPASQLQNVHWIGWRPFDERTDPSRSDLSETIADGVMFNLPSLSARTYNPIFYNLALPRRIGAIVYDHLSANEQAQWLSLWGPWASGLNPRDEFALRYGSWVQDSQRAMNTALQLMAAPSTRYDALSRMTLEETIFVFSFFADPQNKTVRFYDSRLRTYAETSDGTFSHSLSLFGGFSDLHYVRQSSIFDIGPYHFTFDPQKNALTSVANPDHDYGPYNPLPFVNPARVLPLTEAAMPETPTDWLPTPDPLPSPSRPLPIKTPALLYYGSPNIYRIPPTNGVNLPADTPQAPSADIHSVVINSLEK